MDAFAAEPLRVVYFGTPAYALPALEALAVDSRVDLALVVTQPDRPAGRGRKLTPPPVKAAAIHQGIPVYQPDSLRSPGDRAPIAAQHAELFVVAAYGKIFGPRLLALPPLGCVNLHASLLPDYRGASPISASILEGQFRTGVTLMQMDAGLDTGPLLAQRSCDIQLDDTTASLTVRLAELGAELLIASLENLISGNLPTILQEDSGATVTRPIVKADGWIDWSRPARSIERQVRAMWDWPRAWTTLRGEPVQIHRANVSELPSTAPAGTLLQRAGNPVVATGQGTLVLEVAQSAGGKALPGNIWLRQVDGVGAMLGEIGAPEFPAMPLIRPAGAQRPEPTSGESSSSSR